MTTYCLYLISNDRVLGLGAGSLLSFEVGREPLLSAEDRQAASYFLREYNALSAVVGLSKEGYMVNGPTYATYVLNSGSYTMELLVRSPAPVHKLLVITVSDLTSGATLASDVVNQSDFGSPVSEAWVVKRTAFTVSSESAAVSFKVFWNGQSNVDLSSLRIKQSI